MISPVRSHDREGSPRGIREVLRWEGFVDKIGFEPGVKEWGSNLMDDESGDDDKCMRRWVETTGEADGMNLGVDSMGNGSGIVSFNPSRGSTLQLSAGRHLPHLNHLFQLS